MIHRKEFLQKRDEYHKQFSKELNQILEDNGNAPGDDFFSTSSSGVESRAVVELLPKVQEQLELDLNPNWITPGGFETVEETIDKLLEAVEEALPE